MHALSLSLPRTPLCGPGHAVYPPGLVSDKSCSSDSQQFLLTCALCSTAPVEEVPVGAWCEEHRLDQRLRCPPGPEHHYLQVEPTQQLPKTHPEPSETDSGRNQERPRPGLHLLTQSLLECLFRAVASRSSLRAPS